MTGVYKIGENETVGDYICGDLVQIKIVIEDRDDSDALIIIPRKTRVKKVGEIWRSVNFEIPVLQFAHLTDEGYYVESECGYIHMSKEDEDYLGGAD